MEMSASRWQNDAIVVEGVSPENLRRVTVSWRDPPRRAWLDASWLTIVGAGWVLLLHLLPDARQSGSEGRDPAAGSGWEDPFDS